MCNVIVMERRINVMGAQREKLQRYCHGSCKGKVSFNENTPQNIPLQLETFRPEKDASVPTKIKTLVFVK